MALCTDIFTCCGQTVVFDYNGCGYVATGDGHRDALGMGKSGPRTGLRENFFVVAWLCGRTYDTK